VSRAVAGAPARSPLRLLVPLRSAMLGEMTADDVVRVILALDGADVRCWLAGGWGVDALFGRQARRHDDVDLVIDEFDRHLPAACAALQALGMHVVAHEREPVLMPDRCLLEDDARHRVDLVSLDWPGLRSALGAAGGLPEAKFESAFSVGLVGKREVPCLSLAAQLALHSGFVARPVDRHDIQLLKKGSPYGRL